MKDEETTWRKELESHELKTDDIIKVIPGDLDWDKKFDDGYGGPEGVPFIAWTEDKVIFCSCYDGSEWLSVLPRNPVETYEPTHIGGY